MGCSAACSERLACPRCRRVHRCPSSPRRPTCLHASPLSCHASHAPARPCEAPCTALVPPQHWLQEERALREFRAAPYRFPQLKPLAIYHRFQRSRQGDLGEGDPVPADLLLEGLPGCRGESLSQLAAGRRPVALLVGSWS